MTCDGSHLTGLYFVGQKYQPIIDLSWQQDSALDIFLKAQKQLLEYCAGTRQRFDIGYRLACCPFQQKILNAISHVPYGTTLSYKALAEYSGLPNSIRAVARAVGRNPLMMIIPCHRIIGSNGSLVGYAGGLEQKKSLLDLEKLFKNSLKMY